MRRITARSLAAQTTKDWEWVVLLDRHDPFLKRRQRVVRSVGVPTRIFYTEGDGEDLQRDAALAYRAEWGSVVDSAHGHVLMTRMDDDDALAPNALQRVQEAWEWEPSDERRVYIIPEGFRVWNGHYDPVRHESNAWATLATPPGDALTVYGYSHKRVENFAAVQLLEGEPGWLWVRHRDAMSGHRRAERPIDDELRARFPVDWRVLG